MRPIAIDYREAWCQFVARLRCAKTAERIEVLFATAGTLYYIGVPIPLREGKGPVGKNLMRPTPNSFGPLNIVSIDIYLLYLYYRQVHGAFITFQGNFCIPEISGFELPIKLSSSKLQPTGFLRCFDAVGCVIWPVRTVAKMSYNVSSGTSSFYSLRPI